MRTNIPSKFKVPIPKHPQVIKLFNTKGPGDLDICPQDHLLVMTNISTKFEGPNHKHCRIISFSGTVTLTFDLKVILFVCVEVLRPSQPSGVMSSAVSLPNHMFTGQA